VTLAQSLAVGCAVAGQGFPCTVEVYDADGNLAATVDLSSANPETVITGLPPGSYEVVIIPFEPGWPESSDVVTLDGETHADVGYPFNPSNSANHRRSWVYWDRCYPLGQRKRQHRLLHRDQHPQQQRHDGDALQRGGRR
jgi:hypothetical protein